MTRERGCQKLIYTRSIQAIEKNVRFCEDKLWSIQDKLKDQGEDERLYVRRRY